jgi:amidase
VSVAAGLVPVSIGTDTNGSILMPATRNDVYALKPTLGLISGQGIVPICREFDSAGPIARCAADIAALMDVLVDSKYKDRVPPTGYASRLTGSLSGLRIGVLDPKDWHLPPVVATPSEEFDNQQVIFACAAWASSANKVDRQKRYCWHTRLYETKAPKSKRSPCRLSKNWKLTE